ncbi:WYL domain-containing protein [Fulvivirgaceae bacterium BMA12]|uniref:WYL domain-containing protein n=1 Tax=Agaribacillus aureus TaxID=3051825 RepID=A0ABT8LB03_9BACT|nr:WYL domain-containing protein [Fulvivirgaceae bacterium BMA12]
MPVNRNALIRFRTIDTCLRNKYRKWTLEDLIDACSEALYEYEGIDKGVSKRTVQLDIQMMRSDKLGYNAPIIVTDKKYYTYEDPEYSITNNPLTENDLNKLNEVVDILRQFKGFSHFQEMTGMIQRLEDKVYTAKTKQKSIVHLETNESLRGIEYLDQMYQAIHRKQVIELLYQSFKARTPNTILFHPYLLKEYRNRWFVLGRKSAKEPLMTLALDRIKELSFASHIQYIENFEFDPDKHFQHVIGVTVDKGKRPQKVHLKVDRKNAPYIITKPLHPSQQVIAKSKTGIEITLDVQLNFELEREILGFGDSIKVISPSRLRSRIKERLSHAFDLYNTELNEQQLRYFDKCLASKGHVIANYVYTKKEVAKMGSILHHYKTENPPKKGSVYAIRNLLNELPGLKSFLLNKNLKTILDNIDPKLFLTKAIFFDKPAESNWYVTWHQDTTINVSGKVASENYSGWTKKGEAYGVCPPEKILHNTVTVRIHLDDTNEENGALQVLPGSHKNKLSNAEIKLITKNSIPAICEVRSGGIQLMKPLLLHASSKTLNRKNRRVIHLEFNSLELPNGLQWAERFEFSNPG